ncbi:MAG: putative ABC transporter ATP-binding protein YxlF [bacterium ADurb.Bin243]|nr:MAG: putative ABC transporter ATP-binding protein YxlF [bacterium ADurb.Bin243]
MIEVRNLTKHYGDFTAISNVSFDVKSGEIVGFLGPNAAGKTTTMRVITGYLSPSAGSVKVDGYDVYEQGMQVKKIIGYLPEKPPVYPDLSVRSYLKFVAEIKGVPSREINKNVEAAMEKTAVTGVANKLIGNLSKGYQQRVGLAQSLVHNPKVLILDEPTVGLDPTQIIEVRNLIKGLKDSHTVVLSTHILPEVSMTCSRVVIINKGNIIAEDTPANLTKKVATDETIELLVSGVSDDKKLKEMLTSLDGVRSADITFNETDKTHKASILVKSSFDNAPEVAQKIISSNLKLHKMNTVELSLEEAFLRLVNSMKGDEQK